MFYQHKEYHREEAVRAVIGAQGIILNDISAPGFTWWIFIEDAVSIEFMKFIISIPTFPSFVFPNFYPLNLLFALRPRFLLWLSEEAELFSSKWSFSILDKPQKSEKKNKTGGNRSKIFVAIIISTARKKE